MSRLDEIINDEFGVIAVEGLAPDEKIESIYQKYMTEQLSNDDVEEVASCLYDARYKSFAQGFIRGVAAVKGGAI